MLEENETAAFYRGNRHFTVEPTTTAPVAAGEVSIRIAYCGVCGSDMHVFHGDMDKRVGFERILGHEMSGTIEGLGAGVTGLTVGQQVVVRPLDHCGDCPACDSGLQHICHNLKFLGLDTNGAMQPVWNVPAHTVHTLPEGISLKHAALAEPLSVACHNVRIGEVTQDDYTVIIGGGPIGILVAYAAQHQGAKVLISEVNETRLEIARRLGFAAVNPTALDLPKIVNANTHGKGADVVFEVSGSQAGVDAMTAVAACRARIVMVAIHAKKPQIDLFQFFWRELKLFGSRVYEVADYEQAIDMLAKQAVDAEAIITNVAPLSEVQAEFEALDANPRALKTLFKIGADA